MALSGVVLYAGLAGVAIPVGGLIAYREQMAHGHVRAPLLRALIAFGSGTLVGAVALFLVPEGRALIPLAGTIVALATGAVLFLLLDRAMTRAHEAAPELIAMTGDFIPEALALGAALASGGAEVAGLVLLLTLHHVAGGFSALNELCEAGLSRKQGLWVLVVVGLLVPLIALLGFHVVAPESVLAGTLFLVAAGGILFIVFHDLAPQAVRGGHWVPSLGVVAGFAVAVVAKALT